MSNIRRGPRRRAWLAAVLHHTGIALMHLGAAASGVAVPRPDAPAPQDRPRSTREGTP